LFEPKVLCALGRYEEAVEVEWKFRTARGEPRDVLERELGELRRAMATEGPKTAYWGWKLDKARTRNDGPYWEACAYAQLGKTNSAIACLQSALRDRDMQLTFSVMTDWTLDPVRSDPRFDGILKAMGLKRRGR
jgi:hypothetical protein